MRDFAVGDRVVWSGSATRTRLTGTVVKVSRATALVDWDFYEFDDPMDHHQHDLQHIGVLDLIVEALDVAAPIAGSPGEIDGLGTPGVCNGGLSV